MAIDSSKYLEHSEKYEFLANCDSQSVMNHSRRCNGNQG